MCGGQSCLNFFFLFSGEKMGASPKAQRKETQLTDIQTQGGPLGSPGIFLQNTFQLFGGVLKSFTPYTSPFHLAKAFATLFASRRA